MLIVSNIHSGVLRGPRHEAATPLLLAWPARQTPSPAAQLSPWCIPCRHNQRHRQVDRHLPEPVKRWYQAGVIGGQEGGGISFASIRLPSRLHRVADRTGVEEPWGWR
jgi:hypothetical protein